MSLKRLIAIGAIAGMMAATGCSSNVPERNQGNRNGQRVVDAAHHRPDSYTGARNNTTRGLFGRTTRSASRATRSENRATRPPSRSTFGRPHARLGNTFHQGARRYGMNRMEHNVQETAPTHTGRSVQQAAPNRAAHRTEHRATHNPTSNVTNPATSHAPNRTANHAPNRATRRAANNNVNRGTTRNANNTVTGVAIAPTADQATVPVFFNKKSNQPEQQAPQQQIPTITPAPAS